MKPKWSIQVECLQIPGVPATQQGWVDLAPPEFDSELTTDDFDTALAAFARMSTDDNAAIPGTIRMVRWVPEVFEV